MTSDRHGVQVETLSPRATGGALGRLARSNVGLLTLLASSVAFASSGPFAKSLLTAGWTPGA